MTSPHISEERRWFTTGLSRRTLLRGSLLGGAGLAAAALIGCGDDDDDDSDGGGETTATATSGDSTATATATEEDGGSSADTIGRDIQDPDLPYPYERSEPADEPQQGGVFVHGTNFANSIADPTINVTGGTLIVINPVYDKLLGYKMGPEASTTQLELVPELATSWETSEDGLTYTFQIREGVKWQDVAPVSGRDFSADDVKFAFDRYADGSIQAQHFSAVSSVEAVSPTELQITLNEPLVDFIVPMGARTLGIHPKEIVDDGSIERTPIGTGPMVLKELNDQQNIIFERNPDYWRDVHVDGLEVRIIQDTATRLGAFRVGQLDHPGNLPSTVAEAQALEETNPDAVFTMTRVTAGGGSFALAHQNPKFSDDRVRQGLALAMNRDTIIDIVYDGYARGHGHIPWIFPFTEEPTGDQLGKYMHHDPAEAMKLLSAAGAEGLEINDHHFNYLKSYEAQGEIYQQQLRDVGVTLNLVAEDYNTFTTYWVGGNFDEASHTAWGSIGAPTADAYMYDNLHSQSPGNRWKINDETFDDLTSRQRVEHDPEARRELHKQIYDHDLDKMYRIPFPGGNSIDVMQPRVRRLRFGGALGAAIGVYDWTEQINDIWLDK